MKKIEFEGEIYYYKKGKFYDLGYIEVPLKKHIDLAKAFIDSLNLDTNDERELISILNNIKDVGNCSLAIDTCLKHLGNPDAKVNTIRLILPVLTSCFRKNGEPERAIEVGRMYINRYRSDALLVSMAAAFCDIRDYIKASSLCRQVKKNSPELILVQKRIRSESHTYWI